VFQELRSRKTPGCVVVTDRQDAVTTEHPFSTFGNVGHAQSRNSVALEIIINGEAENERRAGAMQPRSAMSV